MGFVCCECWVLKKFFVRPNGGKLSQNFFYKYWPWKFQCRPFQCFHILKHIYINMVLNFENHRTSSSPSNSWKDTQFALLDIFSWPKVSKTCPNMSHLLIVVKTMRDTPCIKRRDLTTWKLVSWTRLNTETFPNKCK